MPSRGYVWCCIKGQIGKKSYYNDWKENSSKNIIVLVENEERSTLEGKVVGSNGKLGGSWKAKDLSRREGRGSCKWECLQWGLCGCE